MLKPIGPDQEGGAAALAANNGREILSQKRGFLAKKRSNLPKNRLKTGVFSCRKVALSDLQGVHSV
jgi:hypothetical protein